MQPTFNPWLGYFNLIAGVDTFVFLDTVQLNQQSWQTRNKLILQGNEYLFSLPIIKEKHKHELFIKDSLLDYRKYDFQIKLLRSLEQNYSKAKYFTRVHPFIKELVLYKTDFLSLYNINIIKKISYMLGLKAKFILLSQSDFEQKSTKEHLVLNICQHFNAKHYLSPLGAKEYLLDSQSIFRQNGIYLQFQDYTHPIYRQLTDSFLANIGIFDLLYNEGFKQSATIILPQ